MQNWDKRCEQVSDSFKHAEVKVIQVVAAPVRVFMVGRVMH